MSDTPETDAATGCVAATDEVFHKGEPVEAVPATFARRLERERDQARRAAEAYREVWEKCSAAVDLTPNHDPLPWRREIKYRS